MMNEVTLPWADKFRELCRTCSDPQDILREFKIYYEQKEKEHRELWNQKS